MQKKPIIIAVVAIMVGFILPVQSVFALDLYTGVVTGGGSQVLSTSATTYRVNCETDWKLKDIYFIGSFNSNSSSATFEVGGQSVSVPEGGNGNGVFARPASAFTPVLCSSGYITFKYYRSSPSDVYLYTPSNTISWGVSNGQASGWTYINNSTTPKAVITVWDISVATSSTSTSEMVFIPVNQYVTDLECVNNAPTSTCQFTYSSSTVSTTTVSIVDSDVTRGLLFLFSILASFIAIMVLIKIIWRTS